MSTTLLNGHRNSMNGHRDNHQKLESAWATVSVRDFFEQMPWSGVPVVSPDLASGGSQASEATANQLDLKLQVKQYFDLFPWDGKPNIAAPVAPIDVQPDLPAEDEITLDGFADLF